MAAGVLRVQRHTVFGRSRRLDALLAADEDARQFYAFYMSMHGELMWHFGGVGPEAEEEAEGRPLRGPEHSAFLGGARDGGIGLIAQAGSWSCLAYLIVFAVYGLLLFAAASIRVAGPAGPVDVAATPQPPVFASGGQQRPRVVLVGRITSGHGCRCWVDQATTTSDARAVPLGRSICVVRGEMEITFDTGAKVVLRSPCKYRVISANSGFLMRGSVTVLVAKGSGAKHKGEKGWRLLDPASASLAEPSRGSEATNPLCFIIRTPNAMLASQGGEFTVGVNDEGRTAGLTLRGLVKSVTLSDTEKRYVDVPKGFNNSPLGPDESKCCFLDFDDTRLHNPVFRSGGQADRKRSPGT